MGNKKYLYGAAVQGIQSFIFGTNKLQEIVGASELVNNICGKSFDDFAGKGTSIVRAAGNIMHIFTDIDECKKAVREFPKKVMEMAPGITISQAVVEFENDFKKAVDSLEKQLNVQRNRPFNSTTLGLIGIRRARNTGLPAVPDDKNDDVDSATSKKRKLAFIANSKLCKNIFGDIDKIKEKITLQVDKIPSNNDWIAIIHADGNGLGKIVEKVGKNPDEYKEFSINLYIATENAAKEAYNLVKDKYKLESLDFIPIRPIVLGGDDLTVICRADFAIEFIQKFLEEFENQTKLLLGQILKNEGLAFDKLTACAGISFMKSSYPFYYGYNLAEELCKRAKEDAKKPERLEDALAPSCLMFYKIQDSFTEKYDDLVKRELTAQNVSFEFGPYYLHKTEGRWTISQILERANNFNSKEGNALKSHYREWISMMFENSQLAEQKLNRMKTTFKGKNKMDKLIDNLQTKCRNDVNISPVYDVISVHTMSNQETKNKEL